MIHVIATIESQPGKRDEILAEFRPLVPLVRAEAGCLEYAPAIDAATDIAAQPAPRPDVLMVVEKWESADHLKDHLAAPHMVAFFEKIADLVTGLSVLILTPA